MKKTRKLLSYLLAVCLILSSVSMAIMAFANEVTADVTINSAAELSAFAAEANAGNTFSGKTVVLNADIDLGGITWTPINKFAGKFYGNNHTISNFQIDATAVHGGFFNVLSWGLVEDLKLTDITATVGNYRFGTLARSVEGTNINNITVKNVVVTTTHGGAFVAGLICHGTVNSQVTMNDCTVENLTVNAEAGAMLIGGITTFVQKNGTEAEGTNIFDNLQVKNFNVTVNGADDFTAVGGLVGQTQSVWQNPRFNNCSVTGLDVTATGKVDVGGFMCYPGSYTYAENCTVEGKIDVTGVTSADNFAGGFFGDYGWGDNVGKGDHMVTNCVADVDVTTQIATAGGFVGSGTNSENKNKNITLTNCTVKGTVTRVEGGTATIGGFVGEADRGHYINCFAVSEPWIGAKLSENIVIENYVAKVGDTKYESLKDAVAAAAAGDTIVLIANVEENVTVNKAVTIDGAGKTYTGQMTLTANVTVKNVNFDGKGYNGYAIVTKSAYIVNVEDCTAKNYGYGFLNLASNNDKAFVKNVTVTNVNYGVKIDRSNGVVLENVDITAAVAGVLNSNYGPKTITVKNSKISIFGTWTRNNTVKTNIVFEGANTVGEFIIDENIDNFKLVPGATLAAPSGLTVTVDLANCEVVYEDGVYQVFDYVAFIKAELLAGRDVVLQKDIVVDGSDIESISAKTNNFGQYFNPGVFNVVGDCDVTFDLNGHTITYNGHAIADYTATHNKDYYYNAATGKYEIHSCTVAHGLFMANDGAKLTIVGNGNVTVHGLASGVYSCSPDSVITVEGGNWYNDGCAVCGGTNIFLYASHGGELYINGGTFEQTLDAEGNSYLIVEHGGNSSNSVIDYSKTKVVVSGGTFIGMNPDEVVFIDQGNGQKFSKVSAVDDDYCADDLGNGVWGIANAVAKIEGVKGYETLDAAFAAAKPGDKVVLLENVNAASAIVMVPAGVIFDLNGCYLTAFSVLAFGYVEDSAENVGGIVISNDPTVAFTILQVNNAYLPLYDSANGCYRFFKYSVEQKGTKVVSDDAVKFGFGIVFETRAAYELLKDEANSGIKFTLTMTVGEYEKNVVFDATHMIQPYSNTYYNNWNLIEDGTKKAPAITITAYNLSKLEGDADITIKADVVSETRVAGVSGDNVFNYTVGTN